MTAETTVGTTAGTTAETPAGTAARTVEVRAFAAARAALGWSQQSTPLAAGASVADVLAGLAGQAPGAAPVLARCAVLLDGRRVADPAGVVVPDGARLDLLPPFAGG